MQALKAVVEMPDADADQIIRSLKQGNWVVSRKLRQELPQIFEDGGALFDRQEQVIQAVRAAFEPNLPNVSRPLVSL